MFALRERRDDPRSDAVVITGPPALPAGSMLAEIAMSRFGSVGPSTEQK